MQISKLATIMPGAIHALLNKISIATGDEYIQTIVIKPDGKQWESQFEEILKMKGLTIAGKHQGNVFEAISRKSGIYPPSERLVDYASSVYEQECNQYVDYSDALYQKYATLCAQYLVDQYRAHLRNSSSNTTSDDVSYAISYRGKRLPLRIIAEVRGRIFSIGDNREGNMVLSLQRLSRLKPSDEDLYLCAKRYLDEGEPMPKEKVEDVLKYVLAQGELSNIG